MDVREDDHHEASVETLYEKKTEAPKGTGPDKRGKAMSALRRSSSRRHRLPSPPVLICWRSVGLRGEEKDGGQNGEKKLGGSEKAKRKISFGQDHR